MYTKQEAIEEIRILDKKVHDGRYKDHYEMQKRIDELVERFGVTYGDVWGNQTKAL